MVSSGHPNQPALPPAQALTAVLGPSTAVHSETFRVRTWASRQRTNWKHVPCQQMALPESLRSHRGPRSPSHFADMVIPNNGAVHPGDCLVLWGAPLTSPAGHPGASAVLPEALIQSSPGH